MRITQEADYALRIVYLLSKDRGVLGAAVLAETAGVTERFTLKILRKLTQSGIVASKKGASGGYMLAVQPSEVNMRRVVEAIDGPLEISRCLDGDYECTRMGNERHLCAFHLIFSKINKSIAEKMEAVTLDRLIDDNVNIENILSKL